MLLVGAVVVSLLLGAYLSVPYFVGQADLYGKEGEGHSGALFDQRDRCIRVLKDLELDFQTGKISADDYENTRRGLTAELGEILTRLDATTASSQSHQ